MQIRLVSRMLRYLLLVWPTAIITGVVVISRILLEVAAVYFISPMVSSLSRTSNTGMPGSFFQWLFGNSSNASNLRLLLVWMGLSQLGLGLMIYLRNVWDTKLSMRAVFHIRKALYDRLQNLHFEFHDRMTSGQLINRAISDLQAVRTFVNLSLIGSLDIIVSIGAYLTLLYMRSSWLMLAALVPIPFWIWMIRRFSLRAQAIYHRQQQATDKVMIALTQNVSGVHVVKAFATEEQEIKNYTRLNRKLYRRICSLISLQSRFTPTLKGFTTLTHIVLFVLAVNLIQRGQLQVGDLMILGLAMGAILNKLQNINLMTEAYQKAIVSSQRIFEILDTPSHGVSGTSPSSLCLTDGQIEFENVTFSYAGEVPVLKEITACIPGRKVTAIVGPVGSGKSTLTHLIARFYDPQVGNVKIDGQDLRSVNLKDLRKGVGYVFQESFLFSDTIKNNIRYGRKDVSDDMLLQAAVAAHADEFIKSLPQGYETLIGEGGVQLSGGQRQRLALARALVYDPKILVLDDATASLDVETENIIQNNINTLCLEKTVIVISNKLRTIQSADHILVMEKGSISKFGTHADLFEVSGHYRELISIQLGLANSSLSLEPQGVFT